MWVRELRERERVRRNHVGLREDGLIWARARGMASARVRASGLKECVKNRTDQGLFQYQNVLVITLHIDYIYHSYKKEPIVV